jgi:hypothetical protein
MVTTLVGCHSTTAGPRLPPICQLGRCVSRPLCDNPAAAEVGIGPREVSFKGAKQAVTAFAPKLEAARPKDRPALIDALLRVIAYHRVGDRPGRWEPRARKRRRKKGAYLHEPRAVTKQAKDRSQWF